MADELLARIRAEIDARLRELRPSVAEYEQLSSAVDAIGGGSESKRRPGRPPRASATPPAPPSTPVLSSAADDTASADTQGVAEDVSAQESGAEKQSPPERSKRVGRAQHNENQQAIIAALEHGSHTVGELVVVTALSRPAIREGLRRLTNAGTISRAKREGKAAYALSRAKV